MKITVEVPPELEVRLRESASRRDAEAVRQLLVEAVAPTVEALLRGTAEELSDDQFEALAESNTRQERRALR
jgi:hypothetical protein